MRLTRHSEQFAASGGVGARAAHRALGPHALSFWELFLRETVQNSWDARASPDGPISFGVHGWYASPDQRALLRDGILTDPPLQLEIPALLASDPLPILVVCDSGTWGLSGPTRADVDPAGGRTDFVDLIRDTGRRASKGLAGGTYGFGKAVLCQASAAYTVVIYTRTAMPGPDASRLIAMAIGTDEYQDQGARYTGRHWWGLARDGVAEPVRGRVADEAAVTLGLRDLITGATGTAVLVIAPRSPAENGPADLHGIIKAIGEAAAEFVWPHIIATPSRGPTIDLALSFGGVAQKFPQPETDGRLRVFAEAYLRCQQLLDGAVTEGDDWPWNLRMLQSSRPARQLGALAWRHYGSMATSVQAADASSEIALIRSPRFVVSYLNAPRHPSGQSTAGVFIADPALDHDFAEAEPPTHDAWIPIKGKHFDPVRRVLKRISENLRPRPAAGVSPDGRQELGVVTVASALGGLLDGQGISGDPRIPWSPLGPPPQGNDHGSGISRGRDSAAGTGNGSTDSGSGRGQGAARGRKARRRPGIRHEGEPRLLITDGRRAVEFPFTVSKPQGLEKIEIAARPDVFIDGGRETEPPAGAEVPEILGWRDGATGILWPGRNLVITQYGESRWSVIVSQPSDTAVSVALSEVTGE